MQVRRPLPFAFVFPALAALAAAAVPAAPAADPLPPPPGAPSHGVRLDGNAALAFSVAGTDDLVTPCSDVPDQIVLTPDGSIPFTISIHSCGTPPLPVIGAIVDIEFSPEADALIAWAPGQPHPIVTGTTGADGTATFHIAGAGCVDWDRFTGPGYIAQVRGDDIILKEPYVTSPDVVNNEGLLPTQLGTSICENGVTSAGLSDAVFHTRAIGDALVEPCSKLTGNPADPVNLDDAVAITPYIRAGAAISCGP